MNERAFTLLYAIGEVDGELFADAKSNRRGNITALKIAACVMIALIPILMWAKLVFTGASKADPSIRDGDILIYYIDDDGELQETLFYGERTIEDVFRLWCAANGISDVKLLGFAISAEDGIRVGIFTVSAEFAVYADRYDPDALEYSLSLTLDSNMKLGLQCDSYRFVISDAENSLNTGG